MGRLSQFFWLMNREVMPDAIERQHIFTHLDIDDNVKKLRRKSLKARRIKEQAKEV